MLVQGHGLAALAANVAARMKRVPCWMLICSPAAEYYEARRTAGQSFSRATLGAIRLLGRINGSVGQGYVALSQHLRDVVRQHDARHPVHIIPVYGVDLAHFRPADRAQARAARGLPAAGAIIFNSSRVAPEKDMLTLIEAFKVLLAEGRDVYLLNRSGGFREFLDHAERAGIGRAVIATDAADPRRELPLDYASADVCVQASRAEGLGFSVLEALACGTPVVATAVGGLVETVKDGVTGWTVPPGDVAALASALREALDRPEEARRRAAAGRKLVQRQYESTAAFEALGRASPSPVPGANPADRDDHGLGPRPTDPGPTVLANRRRARPLLPEATWLRQQRDRLEPSLPFRGRPRADWHRAAKAARLWLRRRNLSGDGRGSHRDRVRRGHRCRADRRGAAPARRLHEPAVLHDLRSVGARALVRLRCGDVHGDARTLH